MAKTVGYTRITDNLSLEFISSCCESIYDFLIANHIDERYSLTMRLQFEDILANYREYLGEDTNVSVVLRRIGSETRVSLTIPGKAHNPFAIDPADDELSNILGQLVGGYSEVPIWSYNKGANCVSLTTARKIKLPTIVSTLVAVILAIITANICNHLSLSHKEAFLNTIINPAFDAFFNIIMLLAGPLIFLSVLSGILNIGDRSTLAKLCGNILFRSIILLYIFTVLPLLISIAIYGIAGNNHSSSDLSNLVKMVLDIIPSNIVDPFTTGNTLQILFLSVCTGFVMLVLGDKITTLDSIVFDMNNVVQRAMKKLCKFMPLFIYLSLFSLITSMSAEILIDMIYPLLYLLVFSIVFEAIYFFYTSRRNKLSNKELFKAILPASIVSFSTASSVAAYEDTKKGCEKMGIAPQIINVGIPLGQITNEISFASTLVFFSFAIAASYGITFSSDVILKMLLAVPILALAVPPVPGGGLATYSIAILLFGLPIETLGIFATVEAITDYPNTQSKVFSIQLMLINTAKRFNMLKKDVAQN